MPPASVRFPVNEPGTGFIFVPADCRIHPGGELKNNQLSGGKDYR